MLTCLLLLLCCLLPAAVSKDDYKNYQSICERFDAQYSSLVAEKARLEAQLIEVGGESVSVSAVPLTSLHCTCGCLLAQLILSSA